MYREGQWVISMGVMDRWSELHAFDHADLESRLVTLPQPPRPQTTGDVLLTCLLVGGNVAFNSGSKVRGSPCKTADLTDAELAMYMEPFVRNVTRWEVQGVVLHDGLPTTFIANHQTANLRFERVYPDGGIDNYNRRFRAWRDWLAGNPGVWRVWCLDINDVTFTEHPFDWLGDPFIEAGTVAVNVEPDIYADNPWHADQLNHLPPEDRAALLGRHRHAQPPNCGAWAADRATASAVATQVCDEIERMERHLAGHPTPCPVVCDMAAFGRVLLERYAGRLRPFPRYQGPPCIHDWSGRLTAV